jgi:hypothetical protein
MSIIFPSFAILDYRPPLLPPSTAPTALPSHSPLLLLQPTRNPRIINLHLLRRRQPTHHRLPRGQRLPQRRQQTPTRLPRLLRHQRINNNQARHRLDDRHRARHHARIMPPLGLEHAVLVARVRDRVLRLPDRRGRLERDAEVDGRAVRDAALDAARVVRLGGQARPRDSRARRPRVGRGVGGRLDEGVVVDGAGDLAAAEAGADLEALGGGDAEHGVREHGFHLVEGGLAEAAGHVLDDAGDGAADAVVAVAEVLDAGLHLGAGGGVGAAHGHEGIDGLAVDGLEQLEEGRVGRWRGVLRRRREHVHRAHGRDEGGDLNAVREAEVFLRNRTRGHPADGLARGAAPAARAGLDAVLRATGAGRGP